LKTSYAERPAKVVFRFAEDLFSSEFGGEGRKPFNMRIGLRILYNATWMGGINYVLNIARMLKSLPEGERPHLTFLTTAPESVEIAHAHAELVDDIQPFNKTRSLDLDFVYPATQLPEAPFGVAWAGWIPDWQCQHYPEMFPPEEQARRFLQYRELARRPATCVFSSRQAIDDTRVLFPDVTDVDWRVFHFPAVFADETWTWPASSLAQTRKTHNIPDNYLIICNQFWKHKNHIVVAETLAENPDLDVHVVMTGAVEDKRWPDYAEKMAKLMALPQVASRVTLTQQISRQEQLDLLFGASGFIQPSLFEGWSTFVEEARALGLPGLLSDIPVHREQNPPGAFFFDPLSAKSLGQALVAFAQAAPSRPDAATAKVAQDAYILTCARQFMAIARDTKARFNPAKHELVAVLADAISDVHDAITPEGINSQANFDRWLANTRLLLREHPEDLARLASRIGVSGTAFADKSQSLLVLATLAKCAPDVRARFLDFELDAEDAMLSDALVAAQSDAGSLEKQAELSVRNTLFRLKDFVRRKLTA
jgi:glycosyltransferase involved in cell wall biosynthesis